MIKVSIIKGSRDKFEKAIGKLSRKISFEEIVTLSDNLRQLSNYDKIINNAIDNNINIVAYTNSYSNITEGGIQNIYSIISPFKDKIDMIFLQNPPKVIEESILRDSNFSCKIEPIIFPSITMDQLFYLKENIGDRIIGQDKAKKEIFLSLYKKIRTNNNKPLVFMFYGPSGVGKTETAKYISEMVNGHDDILRKQMSMFASNEYFTYIFGGKHNEITLTKDLLERKSNVILFDEFDKCSSMFYSSFYQMFDEGYVEDRNYKVDLDNAIIICTSNFQNKDEIRKAVGDPIFFRFDKLVEYIPLSAIEQKRIIELIVKKQYTAFTEKEKETFEIEKMIVYYSKLLIGKLMNFRQAESIISDDIWEKLYLNDLQK